jgi:hypothetical protein
LNDFNNLASADFPKAKSISLDSGITVTGDFLEVAGRELAFSRLSDDECCKWVRRLIGDNGGMAFVLNQIQLNTINKLL